MAHSGRELFYKSGDLMSVEVLPGEGFVTSELLSTAAAQTQRRITFVNRATAIARSTLRLPHDDRVRARQLLDVASTRCWRRELEIG